MTVRPPPPPGRQVERNDDAYRYCPARRQTWSRSAWNGVRVRSACPPLSTDTPLVAGALPPPELEEAAADRPAGADDTADVQSTRLARAGMIPVRQMALRDEQ